MTIQVRVLRGFRVVSEEERTIGGGGERDKVVGIALPERRVVDKWGWAVESCADPW